MRVSLDSFKKENFGILINSAERSDYVNVLEQLVKIYSIYQVHQIGISIAKYNHVKFQSEFYYFDYSQIIFPLVRNYMESSNMIKFILDANPANYEELKNTVKYVIQYKFLNLPNLAELYNESFDSSSRINEDVVKYLTMKY